MTDLPKYLNYLEITNSINEIILANQGIEETLRQIVDVIKCKNDEKSFCFVRILFRSREFASRHETKSGICFEKPFKINSEETGLVQMCFLGNKFNDDQILKTKELFIANIAHLLTTYFDRWGHKYADVFDEEIEDQIPKSTISLNFLQRFLNKNTHNRDIYHDLMPFKVRHILLISSLYDAYAIEREGRFSEHMLGQYGQLNLTSFPRITGVSSVSQAIKLLSRKHFDLIIYMVGMDKKMPLVASRRLKTHFPNLPIFLLTNNSSDVAYFQEVFKDFRFADKIFSWNGDTNIFFSMIKLLEDQVNVENDTVVGKVRVIVLVEDSANYYSSYLTFLYKVLMEQTKRIIDDVSTDPLYKVLRMRARPKVLLATNYEEAVELIGKYNKYLLCLITDVKYERNGKMNEQAGIELLKYTRKIHKNLPVVIQSSDTSYEGVAKSLQSHFIYKNSETLYHDFQAFITNNLGFGDFVFRDKHENEIARATNIKEFEHLLSQIPEESLLFHGYHDHLSMWLMARGEIRVASMLIPKKVSDYDSVGELRKSVLATIKKNRSEQKTGNIVPYNEGVEINEDSVFLLADGSLGGKGRGLAFINALIHNYDFTKQLPDIQIRTPKTFIIGTAEFEMFISRNKLLKVIVNETSHAEIKQAFIKGKLSSELTHKLKCLLGKITKPIAIRSSGLFEDSVTQPFAGIFETYLLPNSHPDFEIRLQQALDAIKLVFASMYSATAKGYVKAINYKIEDEKMAVILQEAVGQQYENQYYPHISGVAQSYNYYPFSHMKPEEGFAVAAVGLGRYVVEGQKAYRFSPKYPGTEINSPKDQFKNSQVKYYSINLDKKNINLLEGEMAGLSYDDIYVSERHGSLKHCASVYNPDNNTIYPGIVKPGPRIVNFANILKHNYIPLAKTLELVLNLGRDAMGSPIEIEYAVDMNKDSLGRASFYILQIKPLISSGIDCNINMAHINKDKLLLFSNKGMGNGKIENVCDIIYLDTEKFDKTKTEEMVDEIEKLNNFMISQNRKYVLIGPGRWGTRDKWIGIPVNWYQISNASVIVETSLDDYPLDASSGSHFFHNVTSMNVGYFTVQPELKKCFIKYDELKKQKSIKKGKYFNIANFEKPLIIKMDGKKRIYLIHT
jgi:CheY-like chemotaxis protein